VLPPIPHRRHAVIRLLVIGALLAGTSGTALAADWKQFHAGPARKGVSPETTLTKRNIDRLEIRWRRATGSSREGVNSSPVVADGAVYVGSDDGRVWSFTANGGAVRWSTRTRGPIRSSPAVSGDTVYVGSDDGRIYALSTRTGRVRWSRGLGGRVTGSPLVVGDRVFIGSRGGTFFALDADTGRTKWRRTTWAVWDAAAYADGTVFVGSDHGKVFAFAATTGRTKWVVDVWGRVRSTPAIHGERVYVGTDMGTLYALDRRSGARRWRTQAVKAGDGFVRCAPAIAEGRVYVSLGLTTTPMDGKVKAFRLEDGRHVWTGEMADYSTSSPAYVNGMVIAGSFDRRLYAFDADTGREVWTSGFPYQGGFFSRGISGSPAISGGRIVIGVRDGAVYSLGLR
jgi:outer membrane protein assembly factor BamB